jgi:hypothetical protein
MTMSSVIRNYLRWFELNRSKRALRKGPLSGRRRIWRRSFFTP